ncbi:MAG: hypothetical protein BHV75_06290 [Bacteroides oleiciplenus]|nr:MAG: hypothetical protein BHV75_06290 [Bacteroides oleiciplenus]
MNKQYVVIQNRIGIILKYLNKIAFYCQEHSLSLVLVTMPAWPTYYENLDKKQLNKMHGRRMIYLIVLTCKTENYDSK